MRSIERAFGALGNAWRFVTGETDAVRAVLARVFEDSLDGAAVICEEGRIVAISNVGARLLGGARVDKLTGRPASEVLPGAMVEAVRRAFSDGRPGRPSPIMQATIGDPDRDGRVVSFVVSLSEVDAYGGPLPRRFAQVTYWNDADRQRRDAELAFVSRRDPLTGAMTRSELIKVIDNALDGDRRRSSGLALVTLDLNRFKSVNDVLGRAAGDVVLKQVVSRLKAAGFETVARLGGDSFAMIRPGRLATEETGDFCQALLDRLTLPYAVGEQRAIVGASVGLTHTEVSGYDAEVLMLHADKALTAAKAIPGNTYVRFTEEMDRRLTERRTLDLALRQARERGQLSICYQPQGTLETGTLVGVEALVRWTHHELGPIPHEQFMPTAEENGEIVEIGRWMLETACMEVAGWPFETRLAVNVSAVQFEFVDVVADVRNALNRSGLPPHRLDIEIAESAFISGNGMIVGELRKLRALGVGVALDDFGAASSSLGDLGQLPVDKVKIGKGFIGRLPADADSGAVIRAVMTLSEALNKVVIADGVDNADQAWMLRLMGCRIGQGLHFGRPRTGAEMAGWFTDKASQSALAG